jgi:hypothetical protein
MHIPLIAQDHGRHSNGFVYGQDRVGSDYVACKAQFAHMLTVQALLWRSIVHLQTLRKRNS